MRSVRGWTRLFIAPLWLGTGWGQDIGPGYVPDVPHAMGSLIQDICPEIREVRWSPERPRVGSPISFSAELFVDEELTDARIKGAQVLISYPDGTRQELPLAFQDGRWGCTLPSSPVPGPLLARLIVEDTLGNRAVELPTRPLSWPLSEESLETVILDHEPEEVAFPAADISAVRLGLDEENLGIALRVRGGIQVATTAWFLYAAAGVTRDYSEKEQGEEISSAKFLIYLPFLFKAMILDPMSLPELSASGLLAGEGDAKTVLKDGALYALLPREKLDAGGEGPFKIFAITVALDPQKGLDISLLKGGDATPYAFVYPRHHEIEILE